MKKKRGSSGIMEEERINLLERELVRTSLSGEVSNERLGEIAIELLMIQNAIDSSNLNKCDTTERKRYETLIKKLRELRFGLTRLYMLHNIKSEDRGRDIRFHFLNRRKPIVPHL